MCLCTHVCTPLRVHAGTRAHVAPSLPRSSTLGGETEAGVGAGVAAPPDDARRSRSVLGVQQRPGLRAQLPQQLPQRHRRKRLYRLRPQHPRRGRSRRGGWHTRVRGARCERARGGGGVCMFRCLPRARSGCTRVSGRARPGGVLSVRTCGQTRAASVLGVHACAQVCAAKVLGVCTYAQTCAVSVFRVQVRAVSVLGVHVWSGACSQGTCSGHARVRNERAQGAHARDASVLRERACAM